jgi:hypothetical protein
MWSMSLKMSLETYLLQVIDQGIFINACRGRIFLFRYVHIMASELTITHKAEYKRSVFFASEI